MTYSLPLFPLSIVICPGGHLPLTIYEARYLDMVKNCLKNHSSFAVVAVLPEGTTAEGDFPFANVGTLVNIVEADVDTVGLMKIRCFGQIRIKVESYTQQVDGLVVGQVTDIPNDIEMPIPDDLSVSKTVLSELLRKLTLPKIWADKLPLEPYQLDDTAWVANRWVELLELPLLQKQILMQLDSPLVRLELIQDILSTGNNQAK